MHFAKTFGRIVAWRSSTRHRIARFREFSDAGLLRGLSIRGKRERVAMLSRIADGGVATPRLVQAAREGRLWHLLMREALTPPGPEFTLEEISQVAHLPMRDVERWFRAMGRGVSSRTDPDYSIEDLRLARLLVKYRKLGLDEKMLFASARILGRNLSAYADTIESLVDSRFSGTDDHAQIAVRLAAEVLLIPEYQGNILAHLVANRLEASIIRQDNADTVGELAVGFADLVGFTSIGEVTEPAELAELAERLDHVTTEAVAAPVRFVKTIGDAVMLISPDANALAGAIREIFVAAQADGLPVLHAGIAWGPALPRAGDWIGRTVNLASRIAAVASEGEILVDEATHDRLDAATSPSEIEGDFALKGYDQEHTLYRLQRPLGDCDGRAS